MAVWGAVWGSFVSHPSSAMRESNCSRLTLPCCSRSRYWNTSHSTACFACSCSSGCLRMEPAISINCFRRSPRRSVAGMQAGRGKQRREERERRVV